MVRAFAICRGLDPHAGVGSSRLGAVHGPTPSVDRTRDGSAPSAKPTQQSSWKHTPNDDQPYVPLSLKHKAYLFGWRSIAPSAWMKSGVAAGFAQLRDSPEEWDQGTKGYGIRYGHRMLNRGVESGIGFGVAALLHQDGRYFRKPSAGFGGRVLHSVSQTFVTHTDNGGRTFAAWRVGGNYGAQFVSNAWRPESERNVGDTMLRGTSPWATTQSRTFSKSFGRISGARSSSVETYLRGGLIMMSATAARKVVSRHNQTSCRAGYRTVVP